MQSPKSWTARKWMSLFCFWQLGVLGEPSLNWSSFEPQKSFPQQIKPQCELALSCYVAIAGSTYFQVLMEAARAPDWSEPPGCFYRIKHNRRFVATIVFEQKHELTFIQVETRCWRQSLCSKFHQSVSSRDIVVVRSRVYDWARGTW